MRLRFTALAAALALAGGSPVAAEVVRATDTSFVTRHEAIVKATPKEVWLALISPAGWWQSAHTWSGDARNLTLTPQAGGCFCERIPEVDEPGRFTLEGSVEHMRVIQAYPEQALRMVGSLGPLQSEPVTGVLTIAISKVDKGTRIVWEYNVGGPMRYEIPVISKAVDGVMGAQLNALAKLLGVVAFPAVTPAPGAGARPGAPAQAPAAAPAPAPSPSSAAKSAPGTALAAPRPAPAVAAPGPAKPALAAPAARPAAAPPKPAASPTPAPVKPAPKPAPKPPAKIPTVDDVFGDLKDKPKS